MQWVLTHHGNNYGKVRKNTHQINWNFWCHSWSNHSLLLLVLGYTKTLFHLARQKSKTQSEGQYPLATNKVKNETSKLH